MTMMPGFAEFDCAVAVTTVPATAAIDAAKIIMEAVLMREAIVRSAKDSARSP